jgi:hypothetical protein
LSDVQINAWQPYKSAREALMNTVQDSQVTQLASKYAQELVKLNEGLKQVLNEGRNIAPNCFTCGGVQEH